MPKINTNLQWASNEPEKEFGVIVGCNWGMEIMLPFWWENYIKENNFPVTFFDFGMSKKASDWCSTRGSIIQLNLPFSLYSKRIKSPAKWERKLRHLGKYNTALFRRLSWFKKSFVYLNTPYQNTIWLDLDCQVNCDLKELFLYTENPSGLALAEENKKKWNRKAAEGWCVSMTHTYNSGVLTYKFGCKILEDWTHAVINSDQLYLGDQDVLDAVIAKSTIKPQILPNTFNWRVNDMGNNAHAQIIHYSGTARKNLINVF